MMQETGQVVELREGGIALVRCQKNSACQHCASVDACQMGHGSEERLVEAWNQVGATVGQQVRISINTGTFLRSSFTVYIVPLVALVACALLGNELAQSFADRIDPELVTALAGVSGLVAAMLVIRARNRKLNREHYLPRIIAIEAGESGADGN